MCLSIDLRELWSYIVQCYTQHTHKIIKEVSHGHSSGDASLLPNTPGHFHGLLLTKEKKPSTAFQKCRCRRLFTEAAADLIGL